MSERVDIDELLSTGAVARILGVSRQHVVDLCDRGELGFVRVGAHRRIPRTEVDMLLSPRLTRDQERSLWLHSAIAGRLVSDPQLALNKARENLKVLERRHPDGMAANWIARWRTILDRGVDVVLEVLTSRTPVAIELRQNSPFAGVLPTQDRDRALTSFRTHWLREHAA